MVRVKICGLTQPRDVEKAIELGADALGFIYEPSSPRYVKWEDKRLELTMIAEPFLPTVAVYGEYRGRKDTCSLVQAVKFHAASDAYHLDIRPGLFVFRFQDDVTYDSAARDMERQIRDTTIVAHALVIDSYSPDAYGGTGIRSNWDLAAELVLRTKYPVILAGGLTPDNVAIAIAKVKPYAVDVSSGIESAPGIKDHTKMLDFIQAAREAAGS